MTTITPTEAVNLVRKNLDEQDPNGSIMYTDENGSSSAYGDNASLDSLIKKFLPEAVNAVHMAAPVQLLEGKEHEFSESDTVEILTEGEDPAGILSIVLGDTSKFLRLVAFQAADSSVVVTDALGEATSEGRKQLNKYIRGRADRPRLVILQGRHSGPEFKYYTLSDASAYESDATEAISQFSYVEEQFYSSEATGYDISRRLRQNIIDCLTAMVMLTFGDQRAEAFNQRANNFSKI